MRYLVILLFTYFFIPGNISAQENEQTETGTGRISLSIESSNFIKNFEYLTPGTRSGTFLISGIPPFVDKSSGIEGYTLLGYFLQPALVYKPSQKITIKAGVHLLQFSGAEKVSRFKPVYSISLNLTDNTALILGSLSGSDKHMLFDPHFARERMYTSYTEDGFQLLSSNEHYFTDTWLNWENYIFKGDSTREMFTFGESFKYSTSPIAEFIRIEVPVQLLLKHYGGEISNFPERVETFLNLATGLKVNFDPEGGKYGIAGIEYIYFFSNKLSGKSELENVRGNASWVRLHYNYKSLYVGMSYMKGNNFYSPNGNPVYNNVFDYKSHTLQRCRKLVTNYFSLNLIPESYLELFLGLETYYDVDQKKMDSAIMLHLNFNNLIQLATIRRPE